MFWKYLRYLILHKWYVFLECCKLGIPLAGLVHDWSKFLPSEFIPYMIYFYGDRNKEYWKFRETYAVIEGVPYGEMASDKFDIAWNHHQKRNPHHWQYWVLIRDTGEQICMPIPDRYRREMLADWRGAGRAITGQDNTKEWYQKNREFIRLRREDRDWIHRQLGITSDPESERQASGDLVDLLHQGKISPEEYGKALVRITGGGDVVEIVEALKGQRRGAK